jgi:hypothetical protein
MYINVSEGHAASTLGPKHQNSMLLKKTATYVINYMVIESSKRHTTIWDLGLHSTG